jgi:hypothetical protein
VVQHTEIGTHPEWATEKDLEGDSRVLVSEGRDGGGEGSKPRQPGYKPTSAFVSGSGGR